MTSSQHLSPEEKKKAQRLVKLMEVAETIQARRQTSGEQEKDITKHTKSTSYHRKQKAQ